MSHKRKESAKPKPSPPRACCPSVRERQSGNTNLRDLGAPLLQFSRPAVSNSVRPHGLQHASLPSITNSQSSLKLTHVHHVGDAIQPSQPLSPPPPPSFNPSQHQGLFQWSVPNVQPLFCLFLSQTDSSFALNTKSSPHGKALLPIWLNPDLADALAS